MKKRNHLQGKTALITGASSGIGAAVAKRMAQEGIRVILTARRLERLQAVKESIESLGGEAIVIMADLENEPDRLALYTQSLDLGGVDILVNNAGFGWYGYFSDMPWEIAQSMLQVNVESVVQLTRLYLPGMKSRGSGHIINVGSIAGVFPNQGIAAYSASKSFVGAFSTALHRELHGSGVHVSLVMPGPVDTEFFDSASGKRGGGRVPAEQFSVSAERIARRTCRLLRCPRRQIYVPWWLGIVPWVELGFGWAIDRLGPLLLRRRL